jgi:hypothetical protein
MNDVPDERTDHAHALLLRRRHALRPERHKA